MVGLCRLAVCAAYPSKVPNPNLWSPNDGPGSTSTIVEIFTAWLTEQGWNCADRPPHGDHPDIDAWRPDTRRRLIAEVKGMTRDADADLDMGYGRLLRRMTGESDTGYALVVSKKLVWWAQRVPHEVRARLGVALYTVDFNGKVECVDGTLL